MNDAPRRGRPAGSVKSATPKKRTMSVEGEASIAAAQKVRRAKQKKVAEKKAA